MLYLPTVTTATEIHRILTALNVKFTRFPCAVKGHTALPVTPSKHGNG